MGFMDWLSPALTTTTQAVSGWQQGQQTAQDRQQSMTMKLLEAQRQKRLDEEQAAMHAAQMSNYASLDMQRKQQAMRNKRAFEGLREAGKVGGEYDDNEDYIGPWGAYQTQSIEQGKVRAKNDRAKKTIQTLYAKDWDKYKTIEDPDYEWSDVLKRLETREDQDRQDARNTARQQATDDRLTRTLAGALQRQQIGIENRPVPEGFTKDEGGFKQLETVTGDVKKKLETEVLRPKNFLEKAIPRTGSPLGPGVPVGEGIKSAPILNRAFGGQAGVDLRAIQANLKHQVALLRAGKALTENEEATLNRYIPDPDKDRPEYALTKIKQFEEELQRTRQTHEAVWSQFYPSVGRAMGGGGPAPVRGAGAPAPAPAGGGETETITVNGKTFKVPKL